MCALRIVVLDFSSFPSPAVLLKRWKKADQNLSTTEYSHEKIWYFVKFKLLRWPPQLNLKGQLLVLLFRKYYPTRFRERLSIQKKYDDIFSCVVEKALMDTSLRSVTPSTLRNKHSPSAFACCPECGSPEVVLRNKYLCRICNVYSENLEDHLRIHYQDRTGGGALMECRTCYKTFQTVQEVRLHEQFSHGTQRSRTVSKHLCDYCELEFSSKHLRDVHLVSHFDRVIGSVWERIEQMQCEYTDQRLVNQCPICFSVMGSRKSFKLHIIQKHLTKNPESFMDILNRPSFMDKFPSVKQDAKTLPITNSVDSVLVKFELKEEPKDL
ncbi:zinc finger, C2H2 type [Necator americanus]|uniref:Zinc finger, C2H2 type n=1 Tax=Necator americanus TaxID=51031 RepID=W2SM53_NECAM|nr:zinc finger, C2H2 type [Necator americanus]ETN69951.1 zinc finger, C2H2 type [Necator americanus]